jgi:hypothetical protein
MFRMKNQRVLGFACSPQSEHLKIAHSAHLMASRRLDELEEDWVHPPFE